VRALKFVAACGLLLLGACASKTQTRVTDAAATPLSDLNLVRAELPEVLVYAQAHTYEPLEDQSCGSVSLEIHKLDEVLGADLDTPASANAPSLLERGGDAAENTAVGAVQRTAEGLIPFRSWVRKLSGAERHTRRVAAAITAGSIRRAFLKGMGAANGCSWGPPPAVAEAASAASGAEAGSAPVAPASSPSK
jgi:hypothetical protein